MKFSAVRQRARFIIIATAAVVAFCIVCIIAFWSSYAYRFYAERIPSILRIGGIAYSEHEMAGFGPGGSAAGVVAFNLPHDVSLLLRREGLVFFQTRSASRAEPFFTEWLVTPVTERDWMLNDPDLPNSSLIERFLARGSVNIIIDESVLNKINKAIVSYNNFYSISRNTQMIVIDIDNDIIYYIYNK